MRTESLSENSAESSMNNEIEEKIPEKTAEPEFSEELEVQEEPAENGKGVEEEAVTVVAEDAQEEIVEDGAEVESTDSPENTEPPVEAKEAEIPLRKIDPQALTVIKRLRAKGYEAYLTGGCVRDLLLGKKPKDFDVATSAKPEEVKKIFRNCRLVGRRFLLAHVCFAGRKIIETSTFRKNPIDLAEDLPEDLLVKDDNVYGTVEEDAVRRDLTINGLFYDPLEGTVLDFVEGRKDLEAQIIRTIGDPDVRFREDPVRIIRAIKFATRLGFGFEEKTLAAMKAHAAEVVRCAPSRLQEEILRLLVSGHAHESLMLFKEVGLLENLMPELAMVLNGKLSTDLQPTRVKSRALIESDSEETEENIEDFDESAQEASEVEADTEDHDELIETIEPVELDSEENTAEDEEKPEPAEPIDLSAEEVESNLIYWEAILKAIDEIKLRKAGIPSPVAFAALLLPAYGSYERSKLNERNWVDRLCIDWSQRIRLPRHDQDHLRLLLSSIELFSPEKLEQKASQYLVRKPWFREALLLYIIHLIAKGESLEALEPWKQLAKLAKKPFMQERYVFRRSNNFFRRGRFNRNRSGRRPYKRN